METVLLAVVIVLALMVLGLFTIVGILIYKLFQMKQGKIGPLPQMEPTYPVEVAQAIAQAKQSREQVGGQFCVDHPELYAKGICAISNLPYCELCLTKEDGIKIARKHLDLYLDNKWETMYMLNHNTCSADNFNELFKVKRELWEADNTPLITHRQFKINVETDKVETYTFVQARTQDVAMIASKLEFLGTEG